MDAAVGYALAQLLTLAATPQRVRATVCPDTMVLVEGVHQEYAQRLCTNFRGGHCFGFWQDLAAFEGLATPIHVCMDRYEWPNQEGSLPVVMLNYSQANAQCHSVGKRLCTEFEWELACEGTETKPFPYGWQASENTCNTDKAYRTVSEAKLASRDPSIRERETARLWQGEPSGSRAQCVSSFGVSDMVGNVEEWVTTSRPEWTFSSSLKGGYWSKPWAGCRGTNDSHGPQFRFYEVGFRCCLDG
jgi:formylglycine-generating enzyme required for sulfatase activity